MNNESVKALHTEWLEYGEEAFEFEVLDRLTPLDVPDYDPTEDLKTLEALWLEKLQPYEPAGYHPPKRNE